MNQRELNRAVARATGESVATIRRMGFSPWWPIPLDRQPQVVDWDDRDADRLALFPDRQQRQPAVA